MAIDARFWRGRRVFLTGHTGFKGSWLALWLAELGAEVTGFSTAPTEPSLFALAHAGDRVSTIQGDLRDPTAVTRAVAGAQPEIVIHMAAQPLVRRSYAEPEATWATNVMGTVNVLEAIRPVESVRVAVVVTSDKAYAGRDGSRALTEDDALGGGDPYSSSKAAAELATASWRESYFADAGPAVATVRAGNVIGGGDWGEDRLVPDFARAALEGTVLRIRHPEAVRPWQHVLNPLSGYMVLAERLWSSREYAAAWNFGPAEDDARPVEWVISRLVELWDREVRWERDVAEGPREFPYLRIDSRRAREMLGWAPAWDLDRGLAAVVEWYTAYRDGDDMREATLAQIRAYQAAAVSGANRANVSST